MTINMDYAYHVNKLRRLTLINTSSIDDTKKKLQIPIKYKYIPLEKLRHGISLRTQDNLKFGLKYDAQSSKYILNLCSFGFSGFTVIFTTYEVISPKAEESLQKIYYQFSSKQ